MGRESNINVYLIDQSLYILCTCHYNNWITLLIMILLLGIVCTGQNKIPTLYDHIFNADDFFKPSIYYKDGFSPISLKMVPRYLKPHPHWFFVVDFLATPIYITHLV